MEAIAQSLLDRGLSVDRPLIILSDNGTENALLQLASMYVGVPVVPVSPAYSLMSQDFEKLKYIFDLIRPGLIFALDGQLFAKAMAALPLSDVELVVARNTHEDFPAVHFSSLSEAEPGSAVYGAFSSVGPDTIAKILFTSGSTGRPKGVINTHNMLCSNQQAIVQAWPFLKARPPVIVDWLPWNHTFGGNFNFNLILSNGGSLYVDHGKPAPGLIDKTIANLRDISPTLYFNVPRGYDMILPALERDEDFAAHFF